jgi:hypothetical protein
VQVSLHSAPLRLALATVLLADVAVVAVAGPTLTLLRTRAALDNVLEHVPRLWLEFVVVVGATIHATHALEMEAITGLLFMEARIVDGPFFLGRWADVVVQALRVLVQGDIPWCCARGKGRRDIRSICGRTGGPRICVIFLTYVLEGAVSAKATGTLLLSAQCSAEIIGSYS